jgi:Tfp pilus assembly PilM family ATPase
VGDVLRKAAGRREQAICAINSPAVDVFPLNLQPSESQSLDALVVSNARKLLSIPLGEAVIDYLPLPDWVKRPTDETLPVLVFSAPRDVVQDILRKTEETGFHIDRLTTPGHVLAPRVSDARPEVRHLIIAVSEEATSISVEQNGQLLLERMLDWSASGVLELLRSEFDLEARQARTLLDRWDCKADYSDVTESALSSSETFEGDVREVLAPAFREITSEAARCLGYCGSFLQHASTAEIVLLGSLANHVMLRNTLEAELGLVVKGAREGLRLPEQINDLDSVVYATAACCAIEYEKVIR